jgi:hypothetical protein
MMVFKNETVTHRYFPEVNTATSIWYGFRKEKAYNEAVHAMLELIGKRHIESMVAVLNDQSIFPTSPDDWTHEDWTMNAALLGLHKLAIVCDSKENRSDTAINGITVHYCRNFDEAKSWLVGLA